VGQCPTWWSPCRT